MMHNVNSEQANELTHTGVIATGRAPLVPRPPTWQTARRLWRCRRRVTASPIHRRYLTVLVEVLVRTNNDVFASTQTIDVTHWTTIGRGEPSVFDMHSAAAGSSLADVANAPASLQHRLLAMRPVRGHCGPRPLLA